MKIRSVKLVTFLFFTTLTSLAFAGGESCNSKNHKQTSASASTIQDNKGILSQQASEANSASTNGKTIKSIIESGLIKS